MRLNSSLRFLLGSVSVVLAVTQATAADLYRGIRLPPELAGYVRFRVTDHEAQESGLGTSVAYRAPGVIATVFVYDFGDIDLPEGIDDPVVQSHALRALEDIRSIHSDVKVLEPLAKASGSCSGFLRAKVSYVERAGGSGGKLHSYLYLGSKGGNFVKLRLSYDETLAFKTGVVSEARFAKAFCDSVAR
jgi:hypothetical protein